MSRNEDDILWKKIKKGDERAFHALFNKYYKSITYRAYKVLADEHIAKDNAQEVFLDLWNKREQKEITTSIGAYLNKAIVFKTIDYIRAQRLDFNKDSTLEQKSINPFQAIEGKELAEVIREAAMTLPERCRIIFLMSRFEELSHKEIAQKLEISPKTVENQITYALKRMRQILAPILKNLKIFIFFLLSIGDNHF